MRLLIRTTAVAVAMAGMAVLADGAQAVTYTQNFANYTCGSGICTGSDTTGSQTTDYLAVFNLPKFDTSLGTLTQIIISVSGSMDATGSVTNSGTSAASGVLVTQNSTITTNPPQNVAGSSHVISTGSNGGDSNLSFTTSASASQSATSAGQSVGTVLAGDTVSGIPLAGTFTTLTLNETSGFDTNLFALGGGTFQISFGTGEFTNTFREGTDGSPHTSVNTNDTIDVSVRYNYSSVPQSVSEPASLALLGVGLIGLGAIFRRRRRAV